MDGRSLLPIDEKSTRSHNLRNITGPDVFKAMETVYVKMSDPNLKNKLAKERTQNKNESFHDVV